MTDLLANPAIQAGIAPFVVALVLALVLRPLGWFWSGLALAAGVLATVQLTVGIQFLPLTSSTRKITMLILAAPLVGLAADLLSFARARRLLRWLLASVAAAAVLWVVWPVLLRKEGLMLWAFAGGVLAYVLWLVAWSEVLRDDSLRAGACAVALGFGTGGAALLGATAFYGQLGISLGASAGALLLVSAFSSRIRLGSVVTFSAALLAGAFGVAAVMLSSLPWYCLLPMLAVPLLVRLPLPVTWPRWLQAALAGLLAALPAAATVAMTWRISGPPPL
jgi:hypothetical protein